jgi:hypothetical protein
VLVELKVAEAYRPVGKNILFHLLSFGRPATYLPWAIYGFASGFGLPFPVSATTENLKEIGHR